MSDEYWNVGVVFVFEEDLFGGVVVEIDVNFGLLEECVFVGGDVVVVD